MKKIKNKKEHQVKKASANVEVRHSHETEAPIASTHILVLLSGQPMNN